MRVPGHEKLTRYISNHRLYDKDPKKNPKKPKYRAFIPQSKSPEEISVYRISSLEDSEIWKIGTEHVSSKIIARADFGADVVDEYNLEVVADTQVHELHANIQPIPLDKEDRDVILRALALASKLVFRPPEDT